MAVTPPKEGWSVVNVVTRQGGEALLYPLVERMATTPAAARLTQMAGDSFQLISVRVQGAHGRCTSGRQEMTVVEAGTNLPVRASRSSEAPLTKTQVIVRTRLCRAPTRASRCVSTKTQQVPIWGAAPLTRVPEVMPCREAQELTGSRTGRLTTSTWERSGS